jgi:putative hemolysin
LIVRGPVIVVANHPFGGVEGLILAFLLRSIRCDVKFLANYLLDRIPEMREMLISVDPFGTKQSRLRNIKPVRESIAWVRNGGMLVVFPAGEVSHFDPAKGAVTDPAWNEGLARLIRKTGAPVLPVFFQGANSALFQVAGMIHPLLRTVMLPAELLNKGNRKIAVRVGTLVTPGKLATFASDRALMNYLRLRTFILEHRAEGENGPETGSKPAAAALSVADAVISPQCPDRLAAELASLPTRQTLVENGEYAVFLARAEQVPVLLLELGRLRELTFRTVGEGTGSELDLDRFDEHYLHLILWNREKKEVVGAYRLGLVDDILQRMGPKGLYTGTLFTFRSRFLENLGPALELGRSFIRPEYQKSYAPLLLLWKGIGRFIVENPRYRTLFGPVSITNEYHPLSRRLMMQFLASHASLPDLARQVTPKNPPRTKPAAGWNDRAVGDLVTDIDGVSELIADIEPDLKGVPILLRQYLKLGGKIVGFNTDPEFGNALDGFIVVDLAGTDRRILERYLGREGTSSFLARHRENA